VSAGAGELERIREGRTDLVAEYVAAGHPAASADGDGVTLLQWCAYYGDVAAVKFLLGQGATLSSLGEDLGLNAAAFHGHWRLCQFLVESGAEVNRPLPDTGETPLHATLCRADSASHELVVRVLLSAGADPNRATKPGVETGAFMRDCRTRGETTLHRAAAFGSEATVQLLLDAGARRETKDSNGDTPLSWASWHSRPDSVLRKLCYGRFSIHPDRQPMERSLAGRPK
jgi:ankyrin repeat protein